MSGKSISKRLAAICLVLLAFLGCASHGTPRLPWKQSDRNQAERDHTSRKSNYTATATNSTGPFSHEPSLGSETSGLAASESAAAGSAAAEEDTTRIRLISEQSQSPLADDTTSAAPATSDIGVGFLDEKLTTDPVHDVSLPQADGLSIDEVINTCLLADPKLRAGFELINQANADALSASLRPNPLLNVGQTLLPLTQPFTPTRQGGPPQLDVGLTYPIDWYLFGKQAAEMTAANAGVRVSRADYEDLIRQRVFGVSLAYYDLAEAIAVRKVVAESLASLRKVEDVTAQAVDNGGKPRLELQRITLDRLAAEQLLRESELAVANSESRLRIFLGGNYNGRKIDVSTELEFTQTADAPNIDESYSEAVANRPDVVAQRRRVEQAMAETDVQYRQAFPPVTPTMGYTRQFQEKAIGYPDANSWGVGVTVGLPMYNRNQGNRFRAASKLNQQQNELQLRFIELRSEVEQATQELRTARANAEAIADEQLEIATQVRESISQAYLAGGRPLIDVLDAQKRFRDTYRLYISSRADYRRAVVKLNSTVGKQVVP